MDIAFEGTQLESFLIESLKLDVAEIPESLRLRRQFGKNDVVYIFSGKFGFDQYFITLNSKIQRFRNE